MISCQGGKPFKFGSFWLKMDGTKEVNSLLKLFRKLWPIKQSLHGSNRDLVGNILF